uniref:Uncharacterized protein n=1 Tax=Hemiselmis tepida TaxID=464990 RepID=A0A7S0YMG0_9CRYP
MPEERKVVSARGGGVSPARCADETPCLQPAAHDDGCCVRLHILLLCTLITYSMSGLNMLLRAACLRTTSRSPFPLAKSSATRAPSVTFLLALKSSLVRLSAYSLKL